MDKIDSVNILDFSVENSNILAQYADIVARINTENGWFESDRTFGDDIALLHTEVSEAFEAYRSHGMMDMTECKSDDPACNCDDIRLIKPEGVGSELADVLVRLLDTAYRYNIDLESEFLRKIQYNATRGHRHGGKLV